MMIPCERFHLAQRCEERGYTMQEVAACIVAEDGDNLLVNCDHPAFPKLSRVPQPGTALKTLLASWPFRITVGHDCECNGHADEMNRRERMEPGWCLDNIETIVGWLRDQAQKRGLPFLDTAGRIIVKRSVSIARREAQRVAQAQTTTAASGGNPPAGT